MFRWHLKYLIFFFYITKCSFLTHAMGYFEKGRKRASFYSFGRNNIVEMTKWLKHNSKYTVVFLIKTNSLLLCPLLFLWLYCRLPQLIHTSVNLWNIPGSVLMLCLQPSIFFARWQPWQSRLCASRPCSESLYLVSMPLGVSPPCPKYVSIHDFSNFSWFQIFSGFKLFSSETEGRKGEPLQLEKLLCVLHIGISYNISYFKKDFIALKVNFKMSDVGKHPNFLLCHLSSYLFL